MTVKPFGTSITKHKLQAHTAPYTAIHCPHTRAVYWPAPRHNSGARQGRVARAARPTSTHPDPLQTRPRPRGPYPDLSRRIYSHLAVHLLRLGTSGDRKGSRRCHLRCVMLDTVFIELDLVVHLSI